MGLETLYRRSTGSGYPRPLGTSHARCKNQGPFYTRRMFCRRLSKPYVTDHIRIYYVLRSDCPLADCLSTCCQEKEIEIDETTVYGRVALFWVCVSAIRSLQLISIADMS